MWRKALKDLKSLRNRQRAQHSEGFFRSQKGNYGYGDQFLGVSVPETRQVARKFQDIPDKDLSKLLQSNWHESRLMALIILSNRSKKALQRKDSKEIEKNFRFFRKHIDHVNNWDLVDVSVAWVVGAHFLNRDDRERQAWLKSASVWRRRIAYVSLLHDARQSQLDRIFDYGSRLLEDKEDLVHKALGWVLREGGKKDADRLRKFLADHGRRMPRTALRYAIEKFSTTERKEWLRKTR